jgi:DNA gyrase inhibitor GyrI
MFYLLLLPLLVIAGVLMFLAMQPGQIAVRRSIVVRCTPEQAFERVLDLRGWRDWSPWLLHEPDAELSYSDEPGARGGWYAWHGQLIGAGRITHVALHPPERIEQRIEFKRPFKTTAAVSWEFAATVQDSAPATEVFWSMRGRMPFLLRFIAPTLSGLIGKDFDLGLTLLRARLDPAAPRLAIRFPGETDIPAQHAWTIPFQGSFSDIKQAMEDGFRRLIATAAERGVSPTGAPFSAYRLADPKGGGVRFDAALPVPEGTAPGELGATDFAGGRYLVTEVQGSYDLMELGWHAAMGHLRMVKRQWDRGRPALEVYEQGPDEAAGDDDLLTRILIPLKPAR